MCHTSEDVQCKRRCSEQIRHIFSTSKTRICSMNQRHQQYKQVDDQVLVQEGTNQKYFPMNKSSLLLIYQS